MTMVALQHFWQAVAKKWSSLRAFVQANQTVLLNIGYFGIAAFLFVLAARERFSLPQDPLEDGDPGYFWPALMKLSGATFAHIQGLNFLYPGMIYMILRIFADFRAISIIQHLLGLIAGVLFLASWSRLGDFFPKSGLNRVVHEAIGLFGAAVYLLSSAPVLLEMRIRSDAVCMFFQILIFWLIIQFFYYQVISPNAPKAVIYGTAAAVSAFLLASLKPSFTLMALFMVAPVIWLMLSAKGNFTGKVAFFGIAVPIIVALTLTEHYLRRNDQDVKTFLPETLFAIHANIIQAQMAADLRSGETHTYSRDWLQGACDDLEREIQRAHNLNPKGVSANYLMVGTDSLLNRWRRQLGDEQCLRFVKYWYWHSVASHPLVFAGKVANQLGFFYSTNCPAFGTHKKLPLASWAYAASFSKLCDPQSERLLATLRAGSDFLERTQKVRFTGVVIQQNKLVQAWNIWCARSYLVILLVSVPFACWYMLKGSSSEKSRWPAFLVIFLYSASFGNVFGISVVHSMVVDRYSGVLFIAALFAQFWTIRWLIEITFIKLRNIKLHTVMGSYIVDADHSLHVTRNSMISKRHSKCPRRLNRCETACKSHVY